MRVKKVIINGDKWGYSAVEPSFLSKHTGFETSGLTIIDEKKNEFAEYEEFCRTQGVRAGKIS